MPRKIPAHLTVALPVYNGRPIAWLAMESLCRQEGATEFPWELIIAEETEANHENPDLFCGTEFFAEYQERLAAAGCVRIAYIQTTRIALSQKWRRIAKRMGARSRYFVLQSADCYSPPNRLAETWRLFEGDAQLTWVQQSKGIFLDAPANRKALFDAELQEVPTALNMAMLSEPARYLPDEDVFRSVDQWLFRNVHRWDGGEPSIGFIEEGWAHGVDVHGFNQISDGRGRMIAKLEAPFVSASSYFLKNLLPPGIIEQLKALAE